MTWLNLLCLDAPLVAIAWQWLFARSLHVEVPSGSRLGLFLTAWLIYLIDRLADTALLARGTPKSARQRFCANHKVIWVALVAGVALFDGVIVFRWIDPATAVRGIKLGAIAAVYLMVNSRLGKLWETLPLKEICVGFLFAGGTLLALAPQLHMAGPSINFAALLFAGLCVLNCASIAVWEQDLDRAQHKYSIATRWSGSGRSAQFGLILLAGSCALLALLDPRLWALSTCLGSSAIFLFTLSFLSIDRDQRTALADLVLLTPLAFLLIGTIV